ncbi:MAG: hypothetical protein ACKOZU_07815 [Planctomycetaceae bacterium]
MHSATHDWLDGLRSATEALRAVGPPAASDDPAALAAERMIHAADLAAWLDATPALLEARRAFAASTGHAADADPAIVITTSPAGVAVAEEILRRCDPLARDVLPRAACVNEREYRAWCMRHPDHDHRLHVIHWSWLKTRVPPQRDAEFARHPLRDGERYWLHRTGTEGAGAADLWATHLWKFDGRHASLLEAFVRERRIHPPGA